MTRIIPAGPAHFATMSAIHAASWRSAYRGLVPQSHLDSITDDAWIPNFAKGYAEGSRGYRLITVDDRPVGCASFGSPRDADTPEGWGEIYSIYMLPGEAGKGYGRLLMQAVLDALRGEGHVGSYLFCLDGNIASHRFYERCGFTHEPSGDKQFELAGRMLTTVRFDRLL